MQLNIRGKLALIAAVVVAATAVFATTANASVTMPGGAVASASVSCDGALTDFDITTDYNGVGPIYAVLWRYTYSTGRWKVESGFQVSPGTTMTALFDGEFRAGWVATYMQYWVYAGGQWQQLGGEWNYMYDKITGQSSYWCYFQ